MFEQQMLPFDFVEEEQKQVEKDQETARQETEANRKKLPQFPQPKNDKERLLQLQYEYRNGRPEAINEFYKISVEVCFKFINAIGKENRHVRNLSWSEKQQKAHDAASYLIAQYLRRPEFAITKNVPGYLYLRVQKELFYQRHVDKIVDFVDLAAFFKEGEEDEQEE